MTHAPASPWLQDAVDEWLSSTPRGQSPAPQALVARLGLAAERQKAEIDELHLCRAPLDQIAQLRQEEIALWTQLKLPPPPARDDLASVPSGQRLAAVKRLLSLRSSLVTQLQQALALQSRARQSLVKAKQRVEKSGSEEDHATLDALHAGLLSDGLLAMIQNESWSDYHSIVEAFISELDQLAGEKAPDIRVLFGLAPNADAKQIKRRYRELVREHHPDQNGHRSPQEQRRREEVFLRIQAAWDAYEKSPA
jgi:DnaJ-domain-containing protein 1